jgi:GNAT superfamily N-acetyltransferase
VSFASRDEHPVLAPSEHGVDFVRATRADAAAVTSFLLEQDVRPAPHLADVTALLGRNDAALFCAVHEGQIKGLAASVSDDRCCHLIHFAIKAAHVSEVGSRLVELVEQHARNAGAIILSAQTQRDTTAFEILNACGFTVDWEEDDAAQGRVVSVVRLLKTL